MRSRPASEMVNFAQTSESHEIYKSGKPFTGTHKDAQKMGDAKEKVADLKGQLADLKKTG